MKHLQKLLFAAAVLSAGSVIAEITEPVLKEGQAPQYPQEARLAEVEGTVMIECLITETGEVFGAEVVNSIHPALDKAALATVEHWKFEPAKENGQPVYRIVQIPIKYDLIEINTKHIGDVSDTSNIAQK